MKDFYYILGTDVNCTSNEIREAYRKLSKKFHPDLNQNDNYFENRFKEIREAYETLIDPAKRNQYDATLKKLKSYPPAGEVKNRRYSFKTKYIDVAFTITLIVITLIFGNYVIKSIRGSKTAGINNATSIGISSPTKAVHHKKKHKFKNIPKTIVINIQPKKIIPNHKTVTKVIADTIHAPVVKPAPGIKLTSQIKSAPVGKSLTTMQLTPQLKPALAAKSVTVAQLAPQPKPVPVVKPVTAGQLAPPIVSNIKTDNKTAVDNSINQNTNASYTASIRSNATGIVYLRLSDNYNADVVTSIPANAQVLVLEKGRNFCKVTFNNKTGYVPNWTVQSK